MSKSEGQKMKLFALKEIPEAETDTTHGITMARILELLSMRGIKAERKSIYDDIRVFRETRKPNKGFAQESLRKLRLSFLLP